MSEHTPGPWWVMNTGVRNHGGMICLSISPFRYTGQNKRYEAEVKERAANARLISSAPDLLDALRRAALALKFAGNSSEVMQDDYNAAIAAIEKATGEKL